MGLRRFLKRVFIGESGPDGGPEQAARVMPPRPGFAGTLRTIPRFSPPSAPGRRPGPVRAQRSEMAYWQLNWQKKGREYQGYFRTPFGSWKGEISEGRGRIRVWIHNPPTQVLNGSHGPCFSPAGKNRYSVHFRIQPSDVDAAILRVEGVIQEAFKR